MIRLPILTLVALLPALPAVAGAPRKVSLQTYASLWTQSPFTVKPEVVVEAREEVNPFEDWALGGVSSVGDRQLVVLFHRKEAGKQMIVDSGDAKGEFKVVEVKQDPDDYKKTQVVISGSGKTGTVTYDDKLLASRTVVNAKAAAKAKAKAAAVKAAAARAKAPPGTRQPRMRVIPQPKKK